MHRLAVLALSVVLLVAKSTIAQPKVDYALDVDGLTEIKAPEHPAPFSLNVTDREWVVAAVESAGRAAPTVAKSDVRREQLRIEPAPEALRVSYLMTYPMGCRTAAESTHFLEDSLLPLTRAVFNDIAEKGAFLRDPCFVTCADPPAVFYSGRVGLQR